MKFQKDLPAHLFITSDGDLYDVRSNQGFAFPLRKRFSYHFRSIATTAQLKATLRAGQFTCPGGYPLYFITSDGATLSFESVRKELSQVLWSIRNEVDDGWRVVGCDVNCEDTELICDHSGELIPSAYGD